jgi:hypothetical protein
MFVSTMDCYEVSRDDANIDIELHILRFFPDSVSLFVELETHYLEKMVERCSDLDVFFSGQLLQGLLYRYARFCTHGWNLVAQVTRQRLYWQFRRHVMTDSGVLSPDIVRWCENVCNVSYNEMKQIAEREEEKLRVIERRTKEEKDGDDVCLFFNSYLFNHHGTMRVN